MSVLVPVSELRVGPIADRVAVWPHDDGSYGVDATFQGLSGYDDLAEHERALERVGMAYTVRQEIDGGWTIRFGSIGHADALRLVEAFIV